MASMDRLGGHLHQRDDLCHSGLELNDDAVWCIESAALRILREKRDITGGLRAGGNGDRRVFGLRSLLLLYIPIFPRVREVRRGRGVVPDRHGRGWFDEHFILIREHGKGAAAKEEEEQENKTDLLHRDSLTGLVHLR
jgi:hypothetical protein